MTTIATAQQSAHGHPEMEAQFQRQLQALLVRSAVDMDFRRRLLTEPNAAYSESTGNAVPSHIQFKFIEKKGATTIVLPTFADDESPISEMELEAVSGGSEPLTIAGAIFLGTAAAAAGAWCMVKAIEYFSS